MTLTRKSLNERTVFNDILRINLEECEISVYLASVGNSGELPEFQLLQVTDDLTQEFGKVANRTLMKLRNEVQTEDLVLHPYDPSASLEPNEVEYFELSDDTPVRRQLESLRSLAGKNLFAVEENFVRGLRFYVIVAQPQKGDPVYFFRSYTPKKELQKSSFFGAVLKKGQFDRVTEPCFLFDQIIDCMSLDGFMYIFSKDKFQRIFQFFEKLLESAEATLTEIRDQVPILNFDEFEAACKGQVQKLAKLNSISRKPYFKSLSMREMKRVIKEFDLTIPTKEVNGHEALVFDRSDKWAILHLLDDYYLRSTMTGLKYGANSKRILT